MRAIVIYESLTGNTEKAATCITAELAASGIEAVACSTKAIDYQSLADADLVILGSWTDGLFLFGQRPASEGRLSQLPFMNGKRGAVFCTYAIETGRTLQKMEDILRDRGADVIGGYAIKRSKIEAGSREFVDRLLGVVAA